MGTETALFLWIQAMYSEEAPKTQVKLKRVFFFCFFLFVCLRLRVEAWLRIGLIRLW